MPVVLFASPVYWPDEGKRQVLFEAVSEALQPVDSLRKESIYQVDTQEKAAEVAKSVAGQAVTVMALSGGVQPWMLQATEQATTVGVFSGYLPDALPGGLSGRLMHANAHPSSTDFYAHLRLAGRDVVWLSHMEELEALQQSWQGMQRLRNAKFLKIGETEPWVINSCREQEIIRDRIGTQVISLERDELYAEVERTPLSVAREKAAAWMKRATGLEEVGPDDVTAACRVTAAMETLLSDHEADGLSMACFAMIGDINTTSCLALSALNDSAAHIGACEGDLDAGLTLFLLKAMGADFVWIGNPIINRDDVIDMVHCTAPTCTCGQMLPYRLMRHHESGKGVSPEVVLPSEQTATLARLSVNAQQLVGHEGLTTRIDKLPACHTQIRVQVASSQEVLDHLLGTHFVLSYGNFNPLLRQVARYLGWEAHFSELGVTEPVVAPRPDLALKV